MSLLDRLLIIVLVATASWWALSKTVNRPLSVRFQWASSGWRLLPGFSVSLS